MGYPRLTSTRTLLAAGGLAVIVGLGLSAFSHQPRARGEAEQDEGGFPGQSVLELDYQSKYSHFKVSRENSTRTLWFVRDNGEEVVESQVNIERPYDLLVEYTRFMFASYLFRPNPDRVLIVGLGGGAMPHFITRYDRKAKVNVVEIDPAIVQVAAKYFGVRSGGNLKIMNADGLDYLKTTKLKYDVIYMDAFLKPSAETDDTGVPVRMKTVNFYKAVQEKLNPDGIVVFNLNPHPGQADDVKMIREAFGSTYVFKLNFGGLVMVAFDLGGADPRSRAQPARRPARPPVQGDILLPSHARSARPVELSPTIPAGSIRPIRAPIAHGARRPGRTGPSPGRPGNAQCIPGDHHHAVPKHRVLHHFIDQGFQLRTHRGRLLLNPFLQLDELGRNLLGPPARVRHIVGRNHRCTSSVGCCSTLPQNGRTGRVRETDSSE